MFPAHCHVLLCGIKSARNLKTFSGDYYNKLFGETPACIILVLPLLYLSASLMNVSTCIEIQCSYAQEKGDIEEETLTACEEWIPQRMPHLCHVLFHWMVARFLLELVSTSYVNSGGATHTTQASAWYMEHRVVVSGTMYADNCISCTLFTKPNTAGAGNPGMWMNAYALCIDY